MPEIDKEFQLKLWTNFTWLTETVFGRPKKRIHGRPTNHHITRITSWKLPHLHHIIIILFKEILSSPLSLPSPPRLNTVGAKNCCWRMEAEQVHKYQILKLWYSFSSTFECWILTLWRVIKCWLPRKTFTFSSKDKTFLMSERQNYRHWRQSFCQLRTILCHAWSRIVFSACLGLQKRKLSAKCWWDAYQ